MTRPPVSGALAGAVAVVLVAGCSGPGLRPAGAPAPSAPVVPHATPMPSRLDAVTATPPPPEPPPGWAASLFDQSPSPDAALPEPVAWQPAETEIRPEIKIAASRVIEALGTAPDQPSSSPAQRLAAVGADPALVASAGALVPPATPSVARVVYPQYGGLTPDASSVMAVVEQTWLTAEDELATRTVTVDVRLARAGDAWRVTELRPVPPVEPASLALPPAVAALATDAGVDLPYAALGDLASRTDPRVVDMLTALSQTYAISISVVHAGHPETIFGTERPSNHAAGRAVDIWAIDGTPVVSMAPEDPLLVSFLTAVRNLGANDVGGPVDLDGPGRIFFTDALHRDHVHIAFDA